ncbi:MAG: NAD(P)/FAD-dependent oxidoreductase [Bacteroidetes bacterium]|nr:MAG: NAD(P)/FAD-dependent oxidoreductase [Bacteroidota bacterium]REK04818.1 MAG: NAD(P)/FAD-dependent oxidoreductase [Bacteroidota bacterium]REK36291.1 MAG: NAD(P)/FAD-dependent oxidoreductase [Bacteroidota bacterium]REK51045.1 MAG: NAD(P)/FAD-dependent oxidoreductase [Bacteroidota bacterium]
MDILKLNSNRKRILILGCGFAGLSFTKHFRDKSCEILVIDKHNYFTFQPLLYQVATGGLEPDSVAYPIRKLFSGINPVSFRMAEAYSVDLEKKLLITSIGELPYDVLIIATGSTTNYFNLPGIEEFALPMKTLPQSLDLRSFILQSFEKALLAESPDEKLPYLNFVIAGGGPTGIEIAGALAEFKHVLPGDYPELDFSLMRIAIVEASGEILGSMSEESRLSASRQLTEIGVELILNSKIASYDGNVISLVEGNKINSKCLIWTAGVKANPLNGLSNDAYTLAGKIKTDEFNRVIGCEDVYALGDVCQIYRSDSEIRYPMLAPVAIQQGKNLARNLMSNIRDEWKAFEYKDRGTMATIGRSKAVADLGRYKLKGFLAWLAWLFIHLILLVGYRNRIVVLINWMWNYFSYDRAIRLIIRPFIPKKNE